MASSKTGLGRWVCAVLTAQTFVCFAEPGALAQVYEIHSNFIDSEFDRLLLKRQSIPEEEYVVSELKPYFSKFCGRRDVQELLEARFVCRNKVCQTSRFKYLMGQFTPNIARQSWEVKVDFGQSSCPKIKIKFGYEFDPYYKDRKY